LPPAADPPAPAHFIWSQHPRGEGKAPQQEGKSEEWLDGHYEREKAY